LDKIKIERINELSRISRERELTPEEIEERTALRNEYINAIRANFRSTLESIEFTDGDKPTS